ncbi:hypothetical protein ICG_05724 [Bacillus cereus BAG1X1-3]|nr:hypothetical protein ICG_05724 [Bacillus cereus BAG1X1-3]EOO75958.1 hypothetical protein IC7_05883 [Bacillus cereus BAG1O-1]SEB20820.1 hypothetical protein SAMN04488146_12014 [Bacillus nitratireducens]
MYGMVEIAKENNISLYHSLRLLIETFPLLRQKKNLCWVFFCLSSGRIPSVML